MHVVELHWTPDVPGAAVTCEVALSRRPDRPVRLRVRLCLGEEELAEHTVRIHDAHSRFDMSIPAARHDMHHGRLLWSPERPTLIEADVEVLDEGGAAFDRAGSYFGFRSTGVRDGRFLLNGQPMFLRLALEQGYWPQSHLAAPDADSLRREAELIKELGFNGIRERYAGADAVARVLSDRWPGRKKVVLGDPVERGLPVVLTEFGGLSYAPAAGEKWFGYGTVGSAEELTERLRGLVDAVLDNPELAGFCYTQLTDTEQERNGLLTEDREPKLPVSVLREILTRPAKAVPREDVEANRRRAEG